MTSQPSTPGPWELDLIYGPEGKPVDGFIDPPGQQRHIARPNTDWLEWEANARLIAAAPELLEALRWFVDDEPCRLDHGGFCQTHGVTKPCLNQAAGMVILKAEGRQPVSGGMSDDEYYDGLRDAASL